MKVNEYTIHKYNFKYYIVPICAFDGKLPYPNNFISTFSKAKAEKILNEMNAAYTYGYIKGTLDHV